MIAGWPKPAGRSSRCGTSATGSKSPGRVRQPEVDLRPPAVAGVSGGLAPGPKSHEPGRVRLHTFDSERSTSRIRQLGCESAQQTRVEEGVPDGRGGIFVPGYRGRRDGLCRSPTGPGLCAGPADGAAALEVQDGPRRLVAGDWSGGHRVRWIARAMDGYRGNVRLRRGHRNKAVGVPDRGLGRVAGGRIGRDTLLLGDTP